MVKKIGFLFPYYGNKDKEIKHFVEFLNNESITTYVDVFGGSASLLRNKHLYNFSTERNKYVYNDINKSLVDMLIDLKEGAYSTYIDYLNEHMDMTYEEYNELRKNVKTLNKLDYYFYHKFSTNNMYPLKNNVRGESHRKMISKSTIEDKKDFINDLRYAEMNNLDYKVIMEKYKYDSDALLFLDPPYIMSFNSCYTQNHDGDKDFINGYILVYLYEFIRTCSCKILIIINSNEIIKHMFKDYIKKEYDVIYNTSKKMALHLVITNY